MAVAAAPRVVHTIAEIPVKVVIHDPDVIERVTGPKGDEWRAQLYNLHTEGDVIDMLAYNCAVNGAQRVNQLDGWADLPDAAATMELEC